ncbi:MAG: hypothetical protein V4714_13890 [Bacteroidota bacterium]
MVRTPAIQFEVFEWNKWAGEDTSHGEKRAAIAHCSLLITHCSLLITHYSLPIAHYPLLITQ